MISVGLNIQGISDELKQRELSVLAKHLVNPDPEVESIIKRLRIIRDIDEKQYARLKKELPYFVCATFSPPYRKSQNFAYTEYFVIDLDHIAEKGRDLHEIKQLFQEDSRVHLIFMSPGEDGLKIIFKLKERCYDAGLYSTFYKAFTKHLAETYDIENLIDYATHDVCRACFLSYDPDTYYNPSADAVELNAFLDVDDTSSMFDLQQELQQDLKNQASLEEPAPSEPTKDILDKIKSTLSERKKTIHRQEENVYVPDEIEVIMDDLTAFMESFQIELHEAINIQYGKKLRYKLENRQAEINLFYGKRGFTVVQSPRSGTSSELNKVCTEIIQQFIYEWQNGLEK